MHLVKLEKKTPEDVIAALTAKVQQLPEMAKHEHFTVDTGVQVYFCDPKNPWQRGTNENANGLLRHHRTAAVTP